MPRKEGHEAEEKVSIVGRILNCGISISAASREVGVGRETILDLYDRRIVSYALSEHNDNPLVYKTFDKAVIAKHGADLSEG